MPERARRLQLPPGYSAAETHAHTLASDGMVTAPELVRAAAAAGIAVLCITDHDTIPSDLEEARELGAQLGVEVVCGEEVTCTFPPGTHIIGLFLERAVRMHMSVEETIDAIHGQGGLAVIAHPLTPFWFATMTAGSAGKLLERRSVDGIELRHTAPMLPTAWGTLDRFYARHREQLGAALGAGDSHFGAHDIGRMVTVFPGRTAADLRHAIEKRLTSPLRGIRPAPPSLRMRLRQQQRSMIWLPRERRAGRVGGGV